MTLKTVVALKDVNSVIMDASIQVLGGPDIYNVLNHLKMRLKESLRDKLLQTCPALLRVRISQSVFVMNLCSFPC